MQHGEENPARVLKVAFHTVRQTDVCLVTTEVWSQSKRFCSGYGVAPGKRQVKSPVTTKPVQEEKSAAVRKVSQPSVAEKMRLYRSLNPVNPPCARFIWPAKPGFTHLPICSGNQY